VTGFFIIRLGADSEKEIREIDAITRYSPTSFSINIHCKQVPKGVSKGDFAVIWLGTNNNKGGKTPWTQGIRAIGQIEGVYGPPGYSTAKRVRVHIGIILPKSITKMDIVTQQSRRYPDIAAMPVLGVNNYSSQVVQRIDPSEPGQSLHALFFALDSILPGLKKRIDAIYPALSIIFEAGGEGSYRSDDFFPEHEDPRRSPASRQNGRSTEIPPADEELDPDEDRESEIEVPFDPTKIDIVAKPMTISSLEDRLDNDELNLTPDFQRQANLWDTKRKSRLIESILLKIPLPSFYFSEDADGGYAVVDGLQRLCTVFHFKNVALLNSSTGANLSPLRLGGLQYLKELEGKTFIDLDRKFQRRLSELEITANIIRANTPSAVKFNVFARLNQGGLPLNAQEIRNAIFPGAWRDHVRAFTETAEFIQVTGGKLKKDRQQDLELVLRFVALWQLGPPYRRPNNQTLDEFLNSTVEHVLNKWGAEKWNEVEASFLRAIDACSRIRGRHAFRKSSGIDQRKPINRGLFEAELITFGAIDDENLFEAESFRQAIEYQIGQALSKNKDFIRSLLSGTGSAEASNTRIAVLNEIIRDAQHA
jgi:hypothetical protein